MLRERLADALTERIVALTSRGDALPSDFDLALELGLQVAELDPDNVDSWRLVQQLADIVDHQEIAARAVDRIVVLDPADEWARLRRLTDHVELANTSEERIEVLRSLLAPERVATIGGAVASRLATDLALLLRRTGDREGYGHWLAEAVALDPSNPAAASELAGVFSLTTDDPGALAELLVVRCVADPANLVALEQLGEFALARGAFVGARRVLDALADLYGGPLQILPDLLTNVVLATWGAGNPDEALRLIDQRQRDEDETMRRKLDALKRAAEEGTLTSELAESTLGGLSAIARSKIRALATQGAITPEQVTSVRAPLWPDLAAARAAILSLRRGPDAESAARELVEVQRLFMDAQSLVENIDPQDRLSDLAECTWWMLFLGDDIPAARAAMDQTFAAGTLPTDVAARLNGWLALREGRVDDAAALLAPVAATDPRARLGEALAVKARGDRLSAAAGLLDAARRLAGSVEGMWALETLLADLGARAPLWNSTPEVEAQIASLPTTFFRLLGDPSRELQFVVNLASASTSPFDRLWATVVIENRSTLPLAIGPGGPLRPTIGLPLSATSFGAEHSAGPLPMPALFDVGTRLRLAPKEKLEVRVNLSRCPVGPGLALGRLGRDLALTGTSVALTGQAILNPVAAAEAGVVNRLRPGELGVKAPPLNFRINGIPFEQPWRTAALEAMKVVDRLSDLDAIGTLGFRLAQPTAAEIEALPPEGRAKLEEALVEQRAGVLQALPQIGPLGQAWVAMMLRPDRPQIGEIEQALRASDDPLVRLAVLLALVSNPDDPILDQTRRGDNPALGRIAELISDRLRREAEARG